MTGQKPTFAGERTALAWQRTGLDFVIVAVLLARAAGGLAPPPRVVPAAVATLVATAVIVRSRARRRRVGRAEVVALGAVTVTVGGLAGVLLLV